MTFQSPTLLTKLRFLKGKSNHIIHLFKTLEGVSPYLMVGILGLKKLPNKIPQILYTTHIHFPKERAQRVKNHWQIE